MSAASVDVVEPLTETVAADTHVRSASVGDADADTETVAAAEHVIVPSVGAAVALTLTVLTAASVNAARVALSDPCGPVAGASYGRRRRR